MQGKSSLILYHPPKLLITGPLPIASPLAVLASTSIPPGAFPLSRSAALVEMRAISELEAGLADKVAYVQHFVVTAFT